MENKKTKSMELGGWRVVACEGNPEKMRSDLAILPVSPPEKSGWPWTEATSSLSPTMLDGSAYPKLSIVTPSFNQSKYLEETIRSVLLQGYPNLEYIIIDGGSTDGSVEIIKKYEPWLAYWVSEKDRGQSFAINKGFDLCNGEILAWINSDDFYLPNCFKTIAEAFRAHHNCLWIAGSCTFHKPAHILRSSQEPPTDIAYWLAGNRIMQPAVFWKNEIWKRVKGIDTTFQYSFDYDLWLKFLSLGEKPLWIENRLAHFRLHPLSKTYAESSHFAEEDRRILHKHQHLQNSIKMRIRVYLIRKEYRTYRHWRSLSQNREDNSIYKILIIVLVDLISAPWLIFKRKTYSKLKAIIRNYTISAIVNNE